ncbi:MAG: CPBP family glutamic-type intramembrane protease, partial [Naasia sp.]
MTAATADRLDSRPTAAPWGVVPAAGVAASAVLLFAFEQRLIGYIVLAVSIAVAFAAGRALAKDLLLIGIGMSIVATVSVEADISWGNIALLGVVLTAAVVVPAVIDRYVYKTHTIRFPVGHRPWTTLEKSYLGIAVVVAYFLLPFYFITSGVYENWPAVREWHELLRLFVGVNAVGIWDELFFVCVIFTLLSRHFPFWIASGLMAVIFVSFLWELGYQSWGPAFTIPFAFFQAFLFTKTKSLPYV